MKICVAQTRSEKGNIESNIANHRKWIEKAISHDADLIVFSELSLTGYEPQLAKNLAIEPNDARLDEFQQISDHNGMAIGVGAPTKTNAGILISMIIFQPNQPRLIYSKQMLHSDETPYFIPGSSQLILDIKNTKVAPAICYESLQSEHAIGAKNLGANIYLTSIAKSQIGIEKAISYYSKTAKKHKMLILMSNAIGCCDDFMSAGQSSIWDMTGALVAQLDNQGEGLLTFDTELGWITQTRQH